jgi:hypothetical protein
MLVILGFRNTVGGKLKRVKYDRFYFADTENVLLDFSN